MPTDALIYYTQPVAMSDPGCRAPLFDGLPTDPAGLARIVQGLLIHQHISPAYGVKLCEAQLAEHLREGFTNATGEILSEAVGRTAV